MDSSYFQRLQQDLKQHGSGMPQLIVDKSRLVHNLNMVKALLKDQIAPRLVVKSLANLSLIQYVATFLRTDRFMVFHLPQLISILDIFPDADYLLGKPMPIRVVEQFYTTHEQFKKSNIQWLIDSEIRLKQYLEIAKQHNLKLKINIEIDVGLHRGGIQSSAEFLKILDTIAQHPQYLRFAGLMGYDAHVAKLPKWLKKIEEAYLESQDIYKSYQELILKHYPELWHEQLCFNGGGSPTLKLHAHKSVCNDVSFGSVLLKPSDFDLVTLQDIQPAVWLATPVLKIQKQVQLPALEVLNKLPSQRQALFIYGGYWLADYVYPTGLKTHVLYGRSSNQEMLTLPLHSSIEVDDYIIARPQQSEAILPQFQYLYFYEQHQFELTTNLRE